jgi:hypothetical protein
VALDCNGIVLVQSLPLEIKFLTNGCKSPLELFPTDMTVFLGDRRTLPPITGKPFTAEEVEPLASEGNLATAMFEGLGLVLTKIRDGFTIGGELAESPPHPAMTMRLLR